ncbi:hypothetical protein D910_12259 [Dendroctonus ponderosae]|uniref:Amino acid transporter transmembrane domain-containing protein n=1 Tax=Dendroctonus ponderosae TaxID=77166 RepID=U4UPE1_DENPD|nr:hypothetical protein D910_12259 [Dendroctonus ponderosae]
MTFQSKDPIINIPLDKVPNKDKVPGSAGGHGIPVEHPTSYVETLMHLLKGNVGSGIFAMGDGIRNAGIIVGPIVVLILGVICTHCQHLLVLDYYGYVLDVHFHMAIILLPILLTALIRNLKYLAPFSTLANVLMCIGIIIVIYYASQDVPSVTERRYIADWQQLPLFFGTAIYAFEGIGLVLPLQNEMKKPGQFTKPLGVLNSGMVIVTIMYLVVGCLSYMKYGDDIRGSVTLNLPQHEVKASPFKNVSERPFMPPANAKLHSTPGDWYGTFEGKLDAFSTKMKARAPFKHEGPNPLTSPGKKGGYGYVNICLNPYPDHSVEKYGAKAKYKQYGQTLDGPMVVGTHPKPFFEPNPYKNPDNIKPGPTYVPPKEKSLPPLPPGKFIPTGPGKLVLGGCKAGCFDKYPEHKAEKYKPSSESKSKKWFLSGTFQPPASGERSYYTCSVINENLRFRVNENNYNAYQPNFIKHLM